MVAGDLVPRWFVLPRVAVALVLGAMGMSGRTTGTLSVVCLSLAAVYGCTAGVGLWRRPSRRGRTKPMMLLGPLFAPLVAPLFLLVGPALAIARRRYLSQAKRDLMHPEEQPLLMLREDAKDGDVWVLSDRAVYVGLKTRDRRPGWRIRREDVVDVSHTSLGGHLVVTLKARVDPEPAWDVTGCFSAFSEQRQVRKLIRELSPT